MDKMREQFESYWTARCNELGIERRCCFSSAGISGNQCGAEMKMRNINTKLCRRCGEVKEASQFDANQVWWNEWCKSCKQTPIGQLPKLGGHV